MPFMTCGRNVPNESYEHEAIALQAYFKWLAADRPEGRALEFWLAAEQEQKAWRPLESHAAATTNS